MSIQNIRNLLAELDRSRVKFATDAANTMLAQIKARVQTERVNTEGRPYSPYSTRPLSPKKWGSLPLRSSGSRREAAINRAKELAGGGLFSYKQWREANRLRTDRKDFTFTGEMLSSLKVFPAKAESGLVKIVISPRDETNKEKLGYNEARDGEILAPDKDTVELIETVMASRYENLIKKYFE